MRCRPRSFVPFAVPLALAMAVPAASLAASPVGPGSAAPPAPLRHDAPATSDGAALEALGQVALRNGNLGEARHYLRAAADASPKDAGIAARRERIELECAKLAHQSLLEAQVYYAAENYPEASSAVTAALRWADSPDDPDHEAALALERRIEISTESAGTLDRSLSVARDSAWEAQRERERQAAVARGAGAYLAPAGVDRSDDSAAPEEETPSPSIDVSANAHPESPQVAALRLRAEDAERQRDLVSARTLYREGLLLDPEDPALLAGLDRSKVACLRTAGHLVSEAKVYIDAENYAEATRTLARAIDYLDHDSIAERDRLDQIHDLLDRLQRITNTGTAR